MRSKIMLAVGAALCLALVALAITADGKKQTKPDSTPQASAAQNSVQPIPANANQSPGMKVHIDPATGQFSETPIGDPAALAKSSQTGGRTSFEDVTETPLPGGGYIADVPEDMMESQVATVDAEGKVTINCGSKENLLSHQAKPNQTVGKSSKTSTPKER